MDGTMTVTQALAYIAMSAGRVFAVEFVKRSTGTLRHMVCRTGVKKGLKNGPMAYEPALKDLVWVYEMSSGERKSIPVEGLRRIKVGDNWLEVVQDSK